MRFFLAALLAVAFNASAYGQQSTEEQLAALLAQAAAMSAEIEAERDGEADVQPVVSQQCSRSDIEACDAETLCNRAITGSPSAWRTNGVWREYSDEAKRRGLTCGVVEQLVETSSATSATLACSLTNMEKCTLQQICERATVGDPKRWQTTGVAGSYANEAQRLALACDVPTCATNTSLCTDDEVCRAATWSTPTRWYTSGASIDYVSEAQRRGLTCGVVERETAAPSTASARQTTSQSGPCRSTNLGPCTEQQLCVQAVRHLSDVKSWHTTGYRGLYADEAQRRGLTCGVVESALTSTKASNTPASNQCSSSTARACTVKQLCERATYGNPRRWIVGAYTTEAKRRGLTCGVVAQTVRPLFDSSRLANGQCSESNLSACSASEYIHLTGRIYTGKPFPEIVWITTILFGALVGALLPIKGIDEKKMLGFLPQRIFNAVVCSLLFCFLVWAYTGGRVYYSL